MLPTQHIIHIDLRCYQASRALSWQASSLPIRWDAKQGYLSQRGSLKGQGRVSTPMDKRGNIIAKSS